MAFEEALPQTPDFDPTHVWHAMTQLLDVGKFFRTYCYRPALDLGFSSNEIDVLLSLKVHPEKNTVKEISETVHLSKGMISQAVESLRKKQLVTVDHNEKDRRSVLIELSSIAQPLAERIRETCIAFAESILNGIPDEQLQNLLGAVTKLYTNKEKMRSSTKTGDNNLIGGAAKAASQHE